MKYEWYFDQNNVIRLIDYMIENCEIYERWDDIRHVLEKPYNYEEEYEKMKEHHKQEDCDHGFNEDGVCGFCGKKETL